MFKLRLKTPMFEGAGFNVGTIGNDWELKEPAHDRDVEFLIDPMDIDETNSTLEVGNTQ